MKAGFIGYRGFSKKLEQLFKIVLPDLEILFYHPIKMLPACVFTNKINDLFSCDFIVIASPDRTHCDYIKELKPFSGYIFCEKVPATSLGELTYLERQKNDKLYFNFNYRKSALFKILQENKDEVLYMNLICCMGLALRDSYGLNWRSKANITPLGVFQTSGIHMLDLLLYTFGQSLSHNYHYSNISPYGDSLDNFSLNMIFNTKNKLKVDLYFSYTAPWENRIELITTDRLIQITDVEITVRGPREYIKDGRFALPPVIESKNISLYDDSLLESVKYFVDIIEKKERFSKTCSPENYFGNRFFLTLQKEIIG